MRKSKFINSSHHLIGSYLKKKREEAGLTQVEIAKVLNCKPQYVCNWERGATTPPWDYLRTIIRLYKIDQTEIIDFLMDIQYKELMVNLGLKKSI